MATQTKTITASTIILVHQDSTIASSSYIVVNGGNLTPDVQALLHGLSVEIIEEDLVFVELGSGSSEIFAAKYRNWIAYPVPRIRTIAVDGTTTLLIQGTDYTVDADNGRITIIAGTEDGVVVRADYYYAPITNELLEQYLSLSVAEIAAAIYRPIDVSAIHPAYLPTVGKRLYTYVLVGLIMEARNFFSLSVAGRSIQKNDVVTNLEKAVEVNEELVQKGINALRLWSPANRYE